MTIAHGAGAGGLEPEDSGQAIAEGAILGLYQFGRYRSKNGEQATEFDELIIAEQDEGRLKSIEAGVSRGRAMAEGAVLARDMVNEPANVMTPTSMAQAARRWPMPATFPSKSWTTRR